MNAVVGRGVDDATRREAKVRRSIWVKPLFGTPRLPCSLMRLHANYREFTLTVAYPF